MNKVMLSGRIGQEIEIRYTSKGTAVCNISIATNEFIQQKKTTEWHRVVVWGKQAENLAKFCGKGREVSVEGRLQTRAWTDREGVKRKTTEIVASRVEYHGRGSTPEAELPTAEVDDLVLDKDAEELFLNQ